jgi:hypothetical protein
LQRRIENAPKFFISISKTLDAAVFTSFDFGAIFNFMKQSSAALTLQVFDGIWRLDSIPDTVHHHLLNTNATNPRRMIDNAVCFAHYCTVMQAMFTAAMTTSVLLVFLFTIFAKH